MLNNLMKNKWVYGLILVLLFALAVLILSSGTGSDSGTEIQVNQQTSATQNETSASQENTDAAAAETSGGYYLVKEEDGVIKVFWCDQNGQSLYQETNIAFSLLGVEDQQLLKDGVKLTTEQELFSFLENFDS